MKITIKVTYQDYRHLMFFLNYRKRTSVYVLVLGLIMLIVTFLYFFGSPLIKDMPVIQACVAVMCLVMIPLSLLRNINKNFYGNQVIQEQMQYDFTKQGLIVTGESFTRDLSWADVYEISELKYWFLVYNGPRSFYILPKKHMNSDQVTELHNFFRLLGNAEVKEIK
jgi:hypothetical protein